MSKTEDRRLVPAPTVWRRYGIHFTTLARWISDPKLGFPKPIKIRARNYFYEDELAAFDVRMQAAGRAAAIGGGRAA